MLKLLFIIGIIAIPFSDFYPILPLGELMSELSVYIFLITIGVFFLSFRKLTHRLLVQEQPPQPISSPLGRIALYLHAVIAFSFIMNFSSMFAGNLHGRYPIDKFFTSTAVISYGVLLAYMTFILSRLYSWHEIVIKPVAISVAICSVVAIFEVLAWVSGPFQQLYILISKFTHMGFDFTTTGDANMSEWLLVGRARSICFEPPALANFAGFAWPWTYAGIYTTKPKHKWIYVLLWICCNALILVANSRTSLLLLPANFVCLMLLKKVYLPPRAKNSHARQMTTVILLSLTFILLAVFFSNTDTIITAIVKGDSTSNITRFASMTAAAKMFLKSPIWGWGFGQYGFHAADFMPAWGFYSWEIKFWLQGSVYNFWPPVFSIFARFAAELGIIGVILWIGIWVQLARVTWRVTYAYQIKTGELLPMAFPIIISCYASLLSGVALDSLRTPLMWVSMGLACSYIYDVRLRLTKLAKN